MATEISIVKQILKHIEIPTLGMYIKAFEHIKDTNQFLISCRYVDLVNDKAPMSENDAFLINYVDFVNTFYINLNLGDYKNPKWTLLKDVIEKGG